MLLSPGRWVTIAFSGGWSNWSVAPAAPAIMRSRGPNERRSQPVAVSVTFELTSAPSYELNVATSARGSHPVGFRKNPSRSTVISTRRSGRGTPSKIRGMSEETTSTPLSVGRRSTRLRSTTLPRLIGPTFDGTLIAIVAASPGSEGSAR